MSSVHQKEKGDTAATKSVVIALAQDNQKHAPKERAEPGMSKKTSGEATLSTPPQPVPNLIVLSQSPEENKNQLFNYGASGKSQMILWDRVKRSQTLKVSTSRLARWLSRWRCLPHTPVDLCSILGTHIKVEGESPLAYTHIWGCGTHTNTIIMHAYTYTHTIKFSKSKKCMGIKII